MDDREAPTTPTDGSSSATDTHAHLEAAETANDETRLQVLEELYRNLESSLEGSGNPSAS
jgi:hypothetical protein